MATRRAARRKAPSSDPAGIVGSLGEWVCYLWPDALAADSLPVWPPDAFAISAAFLRRTGAYIGLVNGTHSRGPKQIIPPQDAEAIGAAWRAALETALGDHKAEQLLRQACPSEIGVWWTEMKRCAAQSLYEAGQDVALTAAMCNLAITSDSACAGIGIERGEDLFLVQAQSHLENNDWRSFCLHISPLKIAVLGKAHTPQRGCTVRSISHNLALYTPAEINSFWRGPYDSAGGKLDVFNLLLLPWPTAVSATDFHVSTQRVHDHAPIPDLPNRYFEYAPCLKETPTELARRVTQALKQANAYANQIHGIVLPEMALTPAQFMAVETVAIRNQAVLISGVRSPPLHRDAMPLNACAIQPLGLTAVNSGSASRAGPLRDLMRDVQLKHHRWCLDRGQILQYDLGGRLPASRDCWERVMIGRRDINFVTIGSWLTMCVLICEDLARQDPVTEVIRAIGPNIVFALLMDGPQLRNRWSSRYASVLAEDPGCSVLSLTSLGMSRRSRPSEHNGVVTDRRSTIALWRDAVFGEKEIALSEGHDAAVLSLVCKTSEEFTIDGRGDGGKAHFPVFAGYFSFAANPRSSH
jgi:hypothetical protein